MWRGAWYGRGGWVGVHFCGLGWSPGKSELRNRPREKQRFADLIRYFAIAWFGWGVCATVGGGDVSPGGVFRAASRPGGPGQILQGGCLSGRLCPLSRRHTHLESSISPGSSLPKMQQCIEAERGCPAWLEGALLLQTLESNCYAYTTGGDPEAGLCRTIQGDSGGVG